VLATNFLLGISADPNAVDRFGGKWIKYDIRGLIMALA